MPTTGTPRAQASSTLIRTPEAMRSGTARMEPGANASPLSSGEGWRTTSEDAGTLLGALDIYDDLREEAPRDIADDWDTVVGSLRRLEEVLADHGVDPSTYSAAKPPAHLDDEGRRAIEAAARDVGSDRTVAAMAAVEQHALDVCGTPLSR